LFVAELVRHVRSGAEDRDAGSLEAVVVDRAQRLPDAAMRVLHVVAVAQRPTPQQVVLAAAGAVQGGVEATALLRTNAFVRTGGPEPDDPIEPFHARIGAAVAASVEAEQVVKIHERLATELARYDADSEVIAYHLVGAGHHGEALGHLEAASVQAMEALAFGRATRLCQRALSYAQGRDSRRVALQRRLADALAYDGRGVRAAEAYQAAAELAPADEVVELRRAAAEQLLRCGRLEEGQAELRKVLAELQLHAPTGPREAVTGLLALRAKVRMRGTEFVERSEADLGSDALLAIDTTYTAATGLLQSNVMLGQYFQARHLLLALDGGEPHRLARALGMEGLYTATGGAKTMVATDLLNEQLAGLSRRLDDPRSLGSSQLALAVADVYRGRFADARPRLEVAEEVFRRRCTNVHWEMAMVRLYQVLSLYYLGDLPAMRRVMADSLQDAGDRDDLYTQLMLRVSFEPLLLLMDDDVAGARRAFADLQREHEGPLSTATYRYSRMLTASRIERYASSGAPAWAPFGEHWSAVRRSLMLTKQPFKIFSLHDRALGALAGAHASQGTARRRLLSRARKDASSLLSEGTHWSRAMALPIQTSSAAQGGDLGAAADLALASERAFAESGYVLYRLSMLRRRGECTGGAEGQDLIAAADREMTALGVAAPARLADMLTPPVQWE
ncbi:MAG: hypothetical protein AAF721_33760, partial [Myxococcota bacterium]